MKGDLPAPGLRSYRIQTLTLSATNVVTLKSPYTTHGPSHLLLVTASSLHNSLPVTLLQSAYTIVMYQVRSPVLYPKKLKNHNRSVDQSPPPLPCPLPFIPHDQNPPLLPLASKCSSPRLVITSLTSACSSIIVAQ